MKELLAAALFLIPSAAGALTIDVYHTSDVHGWYFSRPAKWDKANSTRTIGGFAALSALVKADKNPHLLLDSGDMYQGTPEGNLTKGMATVKLMNQLGYAAAEVGNHDYDYAEANLRELVKASSFTWLGANVYVKDTGARADYLKPYVIVPVAGKRVAVVGIAGRHTATSTFPAYVRHLDFRDEAAEAARWVSEAKKEKPDAVILLVHAGFGGELTGKMDISTWTFTAAQASWGTLPIARAAGADVLIGGHNHAGMLKGWMDKESGTLLAESYYGLTDVSRISLNFDEKTGKLTGASDELVPLWTDVTGEDPAVLESLKAFKAAADEKMGAEVSSCNFDLGVSTTGLDSDIGNWFTDAMRRQAGTDVVLQNTPGIRSDLRKGPVRLRDVFQVMPFDNTLVRLTLTGAQLKRLFADNLRGGSSKLQVSGLRVSFRQTPEGPAEITLERAGKPVDDGEKLTVATNNYLTTGGSGGKVFAEAQNAEDTMQPIRDLLVLDLKDHPIRTLPEGGRIVRHQ